MQKRNSSLLLIGLFFAVALGGCGRRPANPVKLWNQHNKQVRTLSLPSVENVCFSRDENVLSWTPLPSDKEYLGSLKKSFYGEKNVKTCIAGYKIFRFSAGDGIPHAPYLSVSKLSSFITIEPGYFYTIAAYFECDNGERVVGPFSQIIKT